MNMWNPNHALIDKLEAFYKKEGLLNQVFIPDYKDQTVRQALDHLVSDPNPLVQQILSYIHSNFCLDEKICPKTLTGKELIDAMRQGTPYGAITYYGTIPHMEHQTRML